MMNAEGEYEYKLPGALRRGDKILMKDKSTIEVTKVSGPTRDNNEGPAMYRVYSEAYPDGVRADIDLNIPVVKS